MRNNSKKGGWLSRVKLEVSPDLLTSSFTLLHQTIYWLYSLVSNQHQPFWPHCPDKNPFLLCRTDAHLQVHSPVPKASSIPLSIILQVWFIFTDFTAKLVLAWACFPFPQRSCYFLNDFIKISMDYLQFCHISAILDCPPVHLSGIAFTCQ